MLILKQNAANTVPTPPSGKGTIFLDDSDTLSVKTADGNVETFPTVAASNSQVVFMNGTALSGEAAFVYDFNTNQLSLTGNVAAGNILTNNLLYANGSPWDLSDPGGSNTQIQFNDDESFGGSAAFTFNKGTNAVSMTGNVTVGNLSGGQGNLTSLGVTNDITAGNVLANSGLLVGNLIQGTLTTSAQPNITSVGSLNSLTVVGNASTGNVSATTGTFTDISGTLTTAAQPNITSVGTLTSLTVTGNASAGNLSTGGVLSVTGNANVGNLGATGVVATTLGGTLTTASQPNITSVGTLSSLTVTGNGSFGNVSATGGNLTTLGVTGTITTGNVYANSGLLVGNLIQGTLTTSAQPNVTSVGTLGSLSVTGNVSAGNVSGTLLTGTLATAAQPNVTSVGTLTGLSVDGSNITLANGVFVGNGSGLTAIAGANVTGTVSSATTAGTVTTAAQPNITSVGTLTSLSVTGNVSAGNVSGTLLSGTLATAAQPNVTSVGTLTGLSVDGSNITLANGVFVGNGAGLSSIAGANVTGTVANATHSSTANTVVDAAQPNITSVGTLTSLTVTGNASAGNISTGGVLSVTGNANVGNLGATGVVATTLGGTLTTAAQPNITSVGTLSSLAVSGNASAGNFNTAGKVVASTFESNVANGTAPMVVVSTTKVANLNADLLDGYSTATAATANTVVIRDTDGSFSANVITATLSGAATTAGTVTTAAQPNITSVGTLTSLSVTGNANTGNLGTTTVIATTGNITTINSGLLQNGNSNIAIAANGNVSIQAAGSAVELVITSTGANISGTLNATGNANVGNLGTGGLIVATGNITGGNLVTAGALSVTGNANVGNIGAATGVFTSGVTATGNVAAGNLTTTGVLSVTGTGVSSIAGNLDMTSNNIINLASPTSANDAATKQYVDDLASTALVYHEAVTAATTGTLASATGGTITYNNGTSGVGATLTTTGTFNLIDTANVQTVGTRILVKDEANAAHNGVYTYTSTTVITRATDADTYGPGADELSLNNYFFVSGGDVNKGSAYVVDSPSGTITFGTSNILFAQFSSSQVYAAGTGLTLTGTTFSVNASQTQITSVGTLTGLSVNGNITAANITANTGVFTGNGSGLTALNASNISSGTLAQARLANASLTLGNTTLTLGGTTTTVAGLSSVTSTTFVGALTGAATTAGTVTTAAQPNITSVGTLTSLSVTGNANVGNIGAAAGVFTSVSGNGSALTALNGSNITTGTIAAARVATLNQNTTGYAATVSNAAQPNITSVSTSFTNLTFANAQTITGNNITFSTGANTNAGTFTGNFSLSAGSKLNATYADLAERYVADASYEPGTVLVFGGDHEVTIAEEFDSHRVAGVVSTNPAYTMNSECEGVHVVDMALQGRVPCKVHGPVVKGDLMVSGPNGHAVANNMARAGTIIGKALENFAGGTGVIEVAVGRL